MTEFSLPVRVYIEDTDAGGIVYYVNYLKYMERCRTELLRSCGFTKAGANPGGVMFVVTSAAINYRKPARLDDLLQITAQVIEKRPARVTFLQKVLRGEELCCEGEVKIACVESDTLKPTGIPDLMSEAFDRLLTNH